MDHVRLYPPRLEPARQPEAVAAGFKGNRNPRDLLTGPDRLIAPAMQQAKQPFGIRLQLLARLTLNAGENPATSQLDWLISITAMIVLFWSRATRDLLKACPGAGRGRSAGASRHSIGYMQRRSCHFLAARPIASLGPAWGLGRLRAGTAGWTSVANRVGISSIVSRLTPFGYSFNYIQGLLGGRPLR